MILQSTYSGLVIELEEMGGDGYNMPVNVKAQSFATSY